jgi:hypothetical protein
MAHGYPVFSTGSAYLGDRRYRLAVAKELCGYAASRLGCEICHSELRSPKAMQQNVTPRGGAS